PASTTAHSPAAVLGKRATASCLANAIACSAGSNATRAETPTITMPTSPGSALTVITSYRCTLGCCAATRSNASCAVTPVAPPSTTNVCMAYTTPSTVLATAAPPCAYRRALLVTGTTSASVPSLAHVINIAPLMSQGATSGVNGFPIIISALMRGRVVLRQCSMYPPSCLSCSTLVTHTHSCRSPLLVSAARSA